MSTHNLKSSITKEIETFLEFKNILPCALKSDSEGKILSYSDCFKPVELNKINYKIENLSSFETLESNNQYINKDIQVLDLQTLQDLVCFHCDSTFKKNAENFDNFTKKTTSIVGKYTLCSFSIDQQNIQLSDYWINKIKEIADSLLSEEEKAKELDNNIFKVIGYFIPLEIKVGGSFIYNTDDTKSENENKIIKQFNSEINNNNNLLTDGKEKNSLVPYSNNKNSLQSQTDDTKKDNYFLESYNIKGGNIYARNINEWIKSLNTQNCEIIEYKTLTNVKNLLDNSLKSRLNNPLKIIDNKYETRKGYYNILQDLQKTKNQTIKLNGDDSFGKGLCEEKDIPHIYMKKFEAKGDGAFFSRIKRTVSQSFSDIIVGFKIVSRWNDGTNGSWKLDKNPILQKEINVIFTSKLFRGERFEVHVYLMEFPK